MRPKFTKLSLLQITVFHLVLSSHRAEAEALSLNESLRASQFPCEEKICSANAGAIRYLGCNAKCDNTFTGELKSCWKGYCSKCTKIGKQCDIDNPGSCCRYESTEVNIQILGEQRCPISGTCPMPCYGGGGSSFYPCKPNSGVKCCKGTCTLLDPPDNYRCIQRRPECPSDLEGSGRFLCGNYKNVIKLETKFCKCPDTLDGKDVGQCMSGKCAGCLNRDEKCTADGSGLPCCKFYKSGIRQSACVNGVCSDCVITGQMFGYRNICKSPCCDPKAKCKRLEGSDFGICYLP